MRRNMATYGYGPVAQLEQLGLFDVVLPFVLIFTLVFAVLQKSKILGSDSRKYNIVVALVMGLAVVFPHVLGYYPPDRDIVNIINQSLPNVSVVLVAIVMALLIIGMLGRRFQLAGGSLSGWIAFAAFGMIVYIFGNAARWWDSPAWLYFLNDSETVTLIIAILIFAILIWFITSGSGDKVTRMRKYFGDTPEGQQKFSTWEDAYKKERLRAQVNRMLVDPKTGKYKGES